MEFLASDKQRKMFFALAKQLGYSSYEVKERAKRKFNLTSFTEIQSHQIKQLIDLMLERLDQREQAST